MFSLNIGYRWSLANDIRNIESKVFLPSGNHLPKLTRQTLPASRQRLLDPQLYLAGLDAENCSKVCARLASFGWFDIEVASFDSNDGNQTQWQNEIKRNIKAIWHRKAPTGDRISSACDSAIRTQLSLDCTHIILPAPLLMAREDEGATLGEWIDAGVDVANEQEEVGQPLLATVAIHQAAINESVFLPSGLLDAVVDQVTARGDLTGVYVVIVVDKSAHPFDTDTLVLKAYAHLCRGFRQSGLTYVFVNFADTFGLVCAGLGASAFATGASQSVRRMSLDSMSDRGGGKAFPQFYSHRALHEFYSETDLDAIVAKRSVSRVADLSPFSTELMDVLRSRGSAGSLPDWAESVNNCAFAHKHFITRLRILGRDLERMTFAARRTAVRAWLSEGVHVQSQLNDLGVKFKGLRAPAEEWLEIFEEYADVGEDD